MDACSTIIAILLCLIGPADRCACTVPPGPWGPGSTTGTPTPTPTPTPRPTPTPTPTPRPTPTPTSTPRPTPTPTPTPTPRPTPTPTSTPTPTPTSTTPSDGPVRTTPGDLLDLDDWYLTLPTGPAGDPRTVEQPELDSYRGTWFRLNESRNGAVFTVRADGVTTKNSSYPRSELREMNGAEKAAWSNTSGTHTLSVRQAVTVLPPVKPEVVTAQIHDGNDDVVQVRLEGARLLAQYDDGRREITIDPAYELGTVFDLRIVAAARKVQVFYNGTRKAEISRSGSNWYFKTGAYLQTNTSKGDAPGATGQVVLYALAVTHAR